jgi:hypothetical protein
MNVLPVPARARIVTSSPALNPSTRRSMLLMPVVISDASCRIRSLYSFMASANPGDSFGLPMSRMDWTVWPNRSTSSSSRASFPATAPTSARRRFLPCSVLMRWTFSLRNDSAPLKWTPRVAAIMSSQNDGGSLPPTRSLTVAQRKSIPSWRNSDIARNTTSVAPWKYSSARLSNRNSASSGRSMTMARTAFSQVGSIVLLPLTAQLFGLSRPPLIGR